MTLYVRMTWQKDVKYPLVILTDEKHHDKSTAASFTYHIIPGIKDSFGTSIKDTHVWTDGPSTKYKHKCNFPFVDVPLLTLFLKRGQWCLETIEKDEIMKTPTKNQHRQPERRRKSITEIHKAIWLAYWRPLYFQGDIKAQCKTSKSGKFWKKRFFLIVNSGLVEMKE